MHCAHSRCVEGWGRGAESAVGHYSPSPPLPVQYPSNSIPHGQAGPTIFEALWTALLVYVVCAVMTPTHGEDDPNIAEERRGHSRSFQVRRLGTYIL